ncbi:MAG: NrfD/PsrC family molybdoenzyme membrane anchor subunit, partial [Anaerolineae bacterium]|nr:NrfD/PsrC family molybdoenzyme membrane anchor subunit [Anaerolineae bacterium]
TAAQANFMWAELVSEQDVGLHPNGRANGGHAPAFDSDVIPLRAKAPTAHSGTPIRTPQAQGTGYRGPIHIGQGKMSEHMVQTSYNAQHKVPWHWPVPTYLVTKGIGSGMFALLAIFFGLNVVAFDPLLAVVGTFVSLLFIGLTTMLLVYDLEKPQLFLTIVLRPQMKSWLTRGAFILIGFSVIAGLWFLVEGSSYLGLIGAGLATAVRLPLLGLGFILAIGSAIYTAFLFGQAEGRDLWQSTLLPGHLVIQALMVGSAGLLMLSLILPLPEGMAAPLAWIFGVSLAVDLFVILLGEFGMPHASEIAARAAHEISSGKYRNHFWGGAVVVGHILPLILLVFAGSGGSLSVGLVAVAGLATIAGLYLFEYAFVMAPQEVPNS